MSVRERVGGAARWRRRSCACSIALATLAAAAASVAPLGTAAIAAERLPGRGEHAATLALASGPRTYVAYVPASAPDTRAPLVVALHGFGGSGTNILDQGRWREAANRHSFIVLAPDGTVEHSDRPPRFFGNPRSWNSGPDTGSPASARGVDDSGFLRALIRTWIGAGRADPTRVYVTGFSNGAGMAFRAGVELADLVAAIAPVANGLLLPAERLAQPVSVIMIWGEADPVNPIAGGRLQREGGKVDRPSAEATFARWSALLECRDRAQASTPRRDVTRFQHRDCAARSAAEFYCVAGLGHQWPGGRVVLRLVSGPGSNAVDATETIWAFFAAHAR